MEVDKKVVCESHHCILNVLVACMSLMMRKSHLGAVGTTDEAAIGYYLVKWLSKPYTLQENTEGITGMIPSGYMVVDGLYFNRVQPAPLWYKPSGNTMVGEVKYDLRTGLQLQPISTEKCPTKRMCKGQGNAEEGCQGINSGPRGNCGGSQPSMTGWSMRRTMYTRAMKIVMRASRVIPRASSK
jgi:hypothetical protein